MAYEVVRNSRQWRGLSTDVRPSGPSPSGPAESDTLVEVDTGRRFVLRGREWIRQEQTVETLLTEMVELQRETLAVLRATHHGHEEHLWQSDMPVEDVA